MIEGITAVPILENQLIVFSIVDSVAQTHPDIAVDNKNFFYVELSDISFQSREIRTDTRIIIQFSFPLLDSDIIDPVIIFTLPFNVFGNMFDFVPPTGGHIQKSLSSTPFGMKEKGFFVYSNQIELWLEDSIFVPHQDYELVLDGIQNPATASDGSKSFFLTIRNQTLPDVPVYWKSFSQLYDFDEISFY